MNQNPADINRVEQVYFLGIGGIGMSALAHYFLQNGKRVSGYDLTPTEITRQLEKEGVDIHFEEDISQIPPNVDLVIHTPAVPKTHSEYIFFVQQGIPIYKRSEILGLISRTAPTIAVAGTHGKTTTTAMISHLLHPERKVMAFIGGVSKNLDSNFASSPGYETVIVEADEYDRSFLTLSHSTAVITSMDADHMDVYGGISALEESFQLFADKGENEGMLILHEAIAEKIIHPRKITYGVSKKADYSADNIRLYPNRVVFDLCYQEKQYQDVELGITGQYNLLNALAAYAAVREEYQKRGVILDDVMLQHKLASFSGVKRRFDYQVYREDFVFIDDYAHHPKEISSFLHSVKKIFPNKKITGVFQPHLYSRTRDFGIDFARALEALDEVVLLDIYPAREQPIEGISSQWLLEHIRKKQKVILKKEELIPYLKNNTPDVLLTIGAGDIDKLVPLLKTAFL